MTVEEQLYFYGSLKITDSVKLAAEVENIVVDIGLEKKRHALANTLSGVMVGWPLDLTRT